MRAWNSAVSSQIQLLLWLHAQRAVEANALAVEHVVLDDGLDEVRIFLRPSETRWERHVGLQRLAVILRKALEERRVEEARHDGHHADTEAREIAGDGKRQPEHAGLGGGISRLSDLSV